MTPLLYYSGLKKGKFPPTRGNKEPVRVEQGDSL